MKVERPMNRIAQALTKQFECHRIVFWYDIKKELCSDFEALSLVDVEKIELVNNEYRVKHQILREQPEQKFLLYHEGAQPTDLNNWLLDVQLAQGEFRTDQIAMWLAELGLNLEFTAVVQEHAEFYRAAKRRLALKDMLHSDDTQGLIRLKMLAVCAGSEPRLDAILENLLQELSDDQDGIKKTFSGLMKLIFPHGEASKEEIEALLKVAIEGRKRVKDQLMRIDPTYGKVRFTYRDRSGQEVVIKTLEEIEYPHYYNKTVDDGEDEHIDDPSGITPTIANTIESVESELLEQHLTFQENQKGISFDTLFGPYLQGGKQNHYYRSLYPTFLSGQKSDGVFRNRCEIYISR